MRNHKNKGIGRNDPCWCGSGEKYKRCHLTREDEAPLNWSQLRSLHQKPFLNKKICLHPDAPTGCRKIIRAHTIQRAGIMQDLVDKDQHVLTFHPIDPTNHGAPKIHRVGWREASTFFGFCEVHDGTLFTPIEQEPFAGLARQIALIGYRALCHELYQKQAAADAQTTLQRNLDRGLQEPDQRFVQEALAIEAAGRHAGLLDLRAVKNIYDEALRSDNYATFHSAVLAFRGAPIIASTGSVHVDFDLQGNRLQSIARDPAPIHGLNFAIINTTEGCAFVATWPRQFDKCNAFISSLLHHEPANIPSLLIEFCFAYVENTYFSHEWWTKLQDANKRHIERLASIPVQYGLPLVQSGLHHAELELTDTTLTFG